MPDSLRSVLRDLAIAAACVTAGGLARYLAYPYLAPYVPFLILATYACGHYYGMRAGWFALVMAIIPLAVLRSIETGKPIQLVPLPSGLVFISTGACLLLLNRSERRAKESAQRSAAEANEQRKLAEQQRHLAEQHMAEHRKTAAALAESEQRLSMVMQVAQIGTYDFNLKTGHIIWSPLMAQMHGYKLEDFNGTLEAAIAHNHPDDQRELLARVELNKVDLTSRQFTYRVLHPNGEVRWVHGFGQAFVDETGQPARMLGACMDVTDQKQQELARKHAQEELESEKDFLRQCLDMRECERQVFAYEVHDGMIQDITGGKMLLEAAKAQLPPDQSTGLDLVVATLKKAIDEGRRVINGIRTPVLDDEGLIAGIEFLAHERRSQMNVEFIPPEDPLGRLVPELETALYRITQEALTNAVKHSRSPNVQITLSHDELWIYLTIQDWGIGFDPKRTRQGNLGLRGIRERVKLLEGNFDLTTADGEGARLDIKLPLRRRRQPKHHGKLSRAAD